MPLSNFWCFAMVLKVLVELTRGSKAFAMSHAASETASMEAPEEGVDEEGEQETQGEQNASLQHSEQKGRPDEAYPPAEAGDERPFHPLEPQRQGFIENLFKMMNEADENVIAWKNGATGSV